MDKNNNSEKSHVKNLHKRFIKWVLLPPFIALIVLSLFGLWSLNNLLKKQSITDLQRSADTTATVLEREITLRRDVLERTGFEMLVIKNQFADLRKQLDSNRDACRAFIVSNRDYKNSPGGVCDPFASDLANKGLSLGVLEDSYISLATKQVDEQTQRTNERLGAFKQIFPETLAVVIVDDQNNVLSSALSGVLKGSTAPFTEFTKKALQAPVDGEQIDLEDFKLGIFGYPITDGAAIAAYDLYSENFIKTVWDSAPIDRKQALAVIIDKQNKVAYPNTSSSSIIRENGEQLRSSKSSELDLGGVKHTIVTANAKDTGWAVVIASPTSAVLAQSRDAQLVSVIFICLFIIGFVWVGSFFIQRTLANIVRLMSGAMIFSSGRLDYEIQLEDADSEFVRLGETMNKMAQRIAAAEQALDQKNKEFISVATHEIRAPLTSVIGYLDLLQEMHGDKLSKQAKGLLIQSYDGSVRLKNLVNGMLDVARLESGRTEMKLENTNLQSVLSDAVNAMLIVAKERDVTLEYDSSKAMDVISDEPKLRIIINNFISNAIKYNRDGGYVRINHDVNGGQLMTTISDNGLGIPVEQQAQMFQKFFRVDNDDRKSVVGTGLGMYITKQYIEEMNGRLWFESEHGKGTTFYFTLPLAVEENKKIKSKIKSHAKKSLAKIKRSKKRK